MLIVCVCVPCGIELCLLHVQIMSGCVVCGVWPMVISYDNT